MMTGEASGKTEELNEAFEFGKALTQSEKSPNSKR